MTFALSKPLLCLALVSASAIAAPLAMAADTNPAAARMYVQTLDMRSPQATADTFLKAFGRSDYFAVHKLLSPDAQRGFAEAIFTFDPQQLLPRMETTRLAGSLYFSNKRAEDVLEIGTDPSLLFDDILYAAQRTYILPFTFGAKAKVGKVDIRGKAATVALTTDGQPAELTLQMLQLASGRWKIDRIVWPGASTEAQPWGAPKETVTEAQPLRPTPADPRIYPDTLDMKTPEASASGFLKAYARSDYFAVQQMLTPDAQHSVSENLFGYRPEKLIPKMKDNELPGSVLFDKSADTTEVMSDPALTFDDVLFAAQRANILPFTIGAGARLGKVDKQDKQATIEVVTDGKPAALTFQMALLPSGRWKVDQVTWAGSATDMRPWGAKE
ncbi:hypothetical protein FXN63_08030 [Pigmentiphaga aceris]|uniref:DUF3828 domain-containing protein n=1 Tax=Pigmentiphaga aceris TaxID=1940612 RepID=A0A5C0ATW8_9BURK|nr:hypothetical protein [Pigmentiphaga aceris]QEI05802.1 hypothetical protein FXN63_08030 [Pigmentiphaga aceris]